LDLLYSSQHPKGSNYHPHGDFNAKGAVNLQDEDYNQLDKAIDRILEENSELQIAFQPCPTVTRISGEADLVILHILSKLYRDQLPLIIKHFLLGPILRSHGTPVPPKLSLQTCQRD